MNIKIDFYIVIRGEFFGAAFKVRQNINCGDIFVLTTQSILYAKICMKEEWQMTIEELAREYEQQYDRLNAKMDALKPLLCVYRGQDLYLLRKRIRIYYDMASGKNDARPGLVECLKALQPGNTLVVWKLDRLGRDLKSLITTIDELRQKNIGFKVLTGQGAQIDTTTPNGRLVWNICSTCRI